MLLCWNRLEEGRLAWSSSALRRKRRRPDPVQQIEALRWRAGPALHAGTSAISGRVSQLQPRRMNLTASPTKARRTLETPKQRSSTARAQAPSTAVPSEKRTTVRHPVSEARGQCTDSTGLHSHKSTSGVAQRPSCASIGLGMDVRLAHGGACSTSMSPSELLQLLKSALLAQTKSNAARVVPQPQRVTPLSSAGEAPRPGPAAWPSSDDRVQSDSKASSQAAMHVLLGRKQPRAARMELASGEGEDDSDSDIDIVGGPICVPTTGAQPAQGGKPGPPPLTCLFRRPDASPQREERKARQEGLRSSPDHTSEGSTDLHQVELEHRRKSPTPASPQRAGKVQSVAGDGSAATAGSSGLALASDLAYKVAHLPATSLFHFIKELNEHLPANLSFKLVSNQ